jgi:hypothetical protein
MLFAEKWMALKIIILSEISQAQEDKCHISHSHEESRPLQTYDTKIKGSCLVGGTSGRRERGKERMIG